MADDPNGLNGSNSKAFLERRKRLKQRIDILDAGRIDEEPARKNFFHDVYEGAGDDPAAVPWADLLPKQELVDWLGSHSGGNGGVIIGGGSGEANAVRDGGVIKKALDVACGLGDHTNLLADAGYEVIGFDLVPKCIEWAQARFPDRAKCFQVADLFDLPKKWAQSFDLVYECYTLQALSPEIQLDAAKAIASLVSKGGTLLNYTRIIEAHQTPKGPPYPLPPKIYDCFGKMGFSLKSRKKFNLEKADGRKIPHLFDEWERA